MDFWQKSWMSRNGPVLSRTLEAISQMPPQDYATAEMEHSDKALTYRSYRTTRRRNFCNPANSLSIFQRSRYRLKRRRSGVLFFLLLRCGEISSMPKVLKF